MKAKAARKAPNMAAAFSKMQITMRKGVAKSSKRIFFGKNMPNEFKLVGALVLMLAALYVFQLISTPSFLKSQVNSVTGLVVSDTTQQQTAPPPQQTTTTPTSSQVAKKETNQAAQTSTAPAQATPSGPAIKIVEPAKGSTQSPGFTVKVEFNQDAFICYYQVRDNGAVTWDRRMKPCKTEFTVEPGYCKTAGKNTCFVHVDASNQDGSQVSNGEAYYSIQ